MPILVRDQILERVKLGELSFNPPLDELQIQTHSVDLRLGYTFLIPKSWQLQDTGRVAVNLDYGSSRGHFEVVELERGQYFEILPREYVVVATLEKVKLPRDLMAILYPRSSVNRRGLSVDLSGIIDAGYEGSLIVPIRNNTNNQIVRLYPGERFCQLVFETIDGTAKPRTSRYAKKDVVVGVLAEKLAAETKLIKKGKIADLKKKFELKNGPKTQKTA